MKADSTVTLYAYAEEVHLMIYWLWIKTLIATHDAFILPVILDAY